MPAADKPRDMPRRLAPILFAVFNIAIGVATFGAGHAHVPAFTHVEQVMSLDNWAVSFICLGVLIGLGPVHWRLAWATEAVAIFWWLLWASLTYETVGRPGVTARAVVFPVGIALLHFLLAPFRRRSPSRGK